MKRKFRHIFWNSNALNSYVCQEDQQNLRMLTYRLPEILIRIVNVQQDIFKAESVKGIVGLSYHQIIINIPPTIYSYMYYGKPIISQGNLVLSTELITRRLATVKSLKAAVLSVTFRKSDSGLTLEASAFKLFTMANLRYQLSSVITLNYPDILSHWRSTTVSLETYPL